MRRTRRQILRWLKDKWKRDVVTMHRRVEKERRRRKILCPRCGYDVKDMPDQPCPECGLFIESRWRIGRFAAGSPMRTTLPWVLACIAGLQLLRPGVLGFAGYLFIRDLGVPQGHRAWFVGAAAFWVLHALTCVLLIVIAVAKRRLLAYGPRTFPAVLGIGGVAVLLLLLSVWPAVLTALPKP